MRFVISTHSDVDTRSIADAGLDVEICAEQVQINVGDAFCPPEEVRAHKVKRKTPTRSGRGVRSGRPNLKFDATELQKHWLPVAL